AVIEANPLTSRPMPAFDRKVKADVNFRGNRTPSGKRRYRRSKPSPSNSIWEPNHEASVAGGIRERPLPHRDLVRSVKRAVAGPPGMERADGRPDVRTNLRQTSRCRSLRTER